MRDTSRLARARTRRGPLAADTSGSAPVGTRASAPRFSRGGDREEEELHRRSKAGQPAHFSLAEGIEMEPFVYQPLPTRVLFGRVAVTRIKDEAERLGVKRALVLSTPGRGEALARQVSSLLGERSAGIHAGAVMHTPIEGTERAPLVVTDKAADAVIAIGGGSTTGLGKAIALRTDLPQIVLPTTYAGSEMTNILGETEGGVKKTV